MPGVRVTIVFVTHSVFEAAYLADRVAPLLCANPGRVHEIVTLETPAKGLPPLLRPSPALRENLRAPLSEGLLQGDGELAR